MGDMWQYSPAERVLTAAVDRTRKLDPLLTIPRSRSAEATSGCHRQSVLLRGSTVCGHVESHGTTAARERTPLYQWVRVHKSLPETFTHARILRLGHTVQTHSVTV